MFPAGSGSSSRTPGVRAPLVQQLLSFLFTPRRDPTPLVSQGTLCPSPYPHNYTVYTFSQPAAGPASNPAPTRPKEVPLAPSMSDARSAATAPFWSEGDVSGPGVCEGRFLRWVGASRVSVSLSVEACLSLSVSVSPEA